MKTQSIAFKRSVARELDKAGIPYEQDYCEGPYSTDFLIERDGKRIALECKFNVHRDFEKAVMVAQILTENLNLSRIAIVVPFVSAETERASASLSGSVSILSVAELPAFAHR